MATPQRPVNIHKGYHAHIYFDAETVQFASALCHEAGDKFGLRVGRVHEKLVGPHTKWSCQIVFSHKAFDEFVPWLDQKRNGLSVLVHGLTGNDYDDHTKYAYWLGDQVALNLAQFTSEE